MSQPELDVIAQAQEYLRSKQLPRAQRLLADYIKKNPHSEQAWLLLSTAVDDPRKQIECLQRVLRINPANKEAQDRLMQAMEAQAATNQPLASESAPFTPPIEKSVPLGEARPVEPVAVEAVKPVEPAASMVDADLSGLQSKPKFITPRTAGRHWPRIVILLLILLTAIVGGYLMWNRFGPVANPPLGRRRRGERAHSLDDPAGRKDWS